jgi:hypothetical protein
MTDHSEISTPLAGMAARSDHDEKLRLELPVMTLQRFGQCRDRNPPFRLVGAAFAGTEALLLRGGLHVAHERSDRFVQA